MKKYSIIAMILIIAMYILSGCGSKSENYDASSSDYKSVEQSEAIPSEGTASMGAATDSEKLDKNIILENRKLVYQVNMVIQTTEFESTMSIIDKKIVELGGYVQHSQISGDDYGYSGNKASSIIARIPAEKLNQFLNSSKEFGNISSQSQNIEDITMRYTDVEARQKSLQVEFDRLLELVESANKLEDIIKIEERLSKVRYELDSLKSQLKGMDNELSYSTVNMDIREVQLLTSSGDSNFWEKLSSAFSKSLYNLGKDIEKFIIGFFGAIPYLFVIGIIIVIFIWISRKFGKNYNLQISRYFTKRDKLENKEKK